MQWPINGGMQHDAAHNTQRQGGKAMKEFLVMMAIAAGYVAMVAWLALLPSIGALWLLGALK